MVDLMMSGAMDGAHFSLIVPLTGCKLIWEQHFRCVLLRLKEAYTVMDGLQCLSCLIL